MVVLDFECNTEFGFAHIIVEGENEGERLTVQCCLKTLTNDLPPVFMIENDAGEEQIEIDCSDCGHNDGICGDVNAQAFAYWGENRCMKALFSKAKASGIKVNY